MINRKVIEQCPQCKSPIEGRTPGDLKRLMGSHLLHVHGIKGASSTAEGKRAMSRLYYWRRSGLSEEEIKRRMQLYQNKQKAKSSAEALGGSPAPKAKGGGVEWMPVKECPLCEAQFFCKIGGKLQPMKLPICGNCGRRFYVGS